MSRIGGRGAWAAGVGVLVAVVVAFAITRGGDPEAGAAGPHAGVVGADLSPSALNAVEASSTVVDDAALVAEGRRLFRSTELARSGESCQGCHIEGGGVNPELGTILHPQETGDFTGPRDAPSLWGVGSTGPYGWGGGTPTLEEFVAGTIESHFEGGRDQPAAETGRQVAAITAYLETLDPPVTDFDQGTLSPAALRGEELFQGKGGCMACHGGPLLTDNALHDTLVPKVSAGDTDWGAAPRGPLRGAFNTPHLRDLRSTAPYMHNGSLKTLRDVVTFYNDRSSVAPLSLTPAEIDDLVVYLRSL